MPAVVIRVLVVRVVLSCAVGAAVLVASSLLATPALVQAPAGTAPAPGTRSAQGADRVAALLVEHRCWSGEAPAGAPEPMHAVVTAPGARPRLVDASIGYGIWLDGDPGVLHGLCP